MANEKQRLLKVKATLKKRQPVFIRQDAHKHKRVKQVWRAPKGLHSKMKDSKKGYRAKLQGGYQTPVAVRGLDKHGLKPTLVAGVEQLSALDPNAHSLILQKGLGGRKRLQIIEESAKKKFTILNAPADAAEKIKSRLEKQHKESKERATERTKKHESLEKKAEEAAKDADAPEGHDHADHDHSHGPDVHVHGHKHPDQKEESDVEPDEKAAPKKTAKKAAKKAAKKGDQ